MFKWKKMFKASYGFRCSTTVGRQHENKMLKAFMNFAQME